MFDLLLFAFVIWSLLEYRLDEREGRLFLAAFVYGAGMANNWAMVGFLPVFRRRHHLDSRLELFQFAFFRRMALVRAAGNVVLSFAAAAGGGFRQSAGDVLGDVEIQPGGAVSGGEGLFRPWRCAGDPGAAVVGLAGAGVDDGHPLAFVLWRQQSDGPGAGILHVSFVHAIFLVVCVWVAFDPPFSPREKGFGLTLYYLSALSVGYYSGYFLLVFRGELGTRFQKQGTSSFNFLNFLAVAAVGLLLLTAVAGLIYKNTSPIRAANDDTFQRYTSLVAESLPAAGGILLSDDPPPQSCACI